MWSFCSPVLPLSPIRISVCWDWRSWLWPSPCTIIIAERARRRRGRRVASDETFQGDKAAPPERVVSRRDLWAMAFRSFFLQSSFNYERMQAGGWLYSLMPALKKIYREPKELAAAMKRHLEFFNTHPFLVTPILGIVAAMEESREKPDTIRGIKVGMMGPLGGIGDAVAWLTLLPITAGLGAAIAMEGSFAGPIFFLLT